ncbi:MAG: hypothetical protein L6Q37_02185, partial [Bdellovibrionaceae bacterium]|nr:hypothetical protein [Pseudobdellovibrionaceae bacterium]
MKKRYLLLLAVLMQTLGCSKSSDSNNAGIDNSKLITSTFTEVNTQAAKVAKIADADLTTSNTSSLGIGILSAPNFGNFWSTTDATNDVYDNSG